MAPHLKRTVFSPVDATWLRMDRLTNKMMITGVMMFEQPLDFGRVKDILGERMLRHDRFRQRVRETPLGLTLPQLGRRSPFRPQRPRAPGGACPRRATWRLCRSWSAT